jgi:threonine dehydrogenase-like Zn-dependent dehydrogenase
MTKMKAAVFVEPGRIVLDDKTVPDIGPPDALIKVTTTTMSTGFSGAESGGIRIGDTVAVFAQGLIGLCATAGARLCGASTIIAVYAVQGGSRPPANSALIIVWTSRKSILSTRSCA